MGQYRAQRSNYLGTLNALLRELRGYTTLVNELVQNTDDALSQKKTATSENKMIFDVRDDALVIQDTGGFNDCGVDEEICPWESDPKIGHRCDFHRLSETAAADKRNQGDTIGAFGIGFISVYQVTDRPELKSGRRHWTISPEKREAERIYEQKIDPFPGTELRLAWATDPDSIVRKKLGVQAKVLPEASNRLAEEISRAMPSAILFVKTLAHIELRRNGIVQKVVKRRKSDNLIEVEDGQGKVQQWHLFEGSFAAKEASLRALSQNRIEEKRTPQVVIAMPAGRTDVHGFFHAFLPTLQDVGLPFHVNADFFTPADRKRVLLEDDYQGEWNKAAIQAAAHTVANTALPLLPERLEAKGFWELLSKMETLHKSALQGQAEQILSIFWEQVKPKVEKMPSVFSSTKQWCFPNQIYLLSNKNKEQPQLAILEKIGLSIVDLSLNKHRYLLNEIGVQTFSLNHLSKALIDAGLNKAMAIEQAPTWLQEKSDRDMLGAEIAILLERNEDETARQDLLNCAIARSSNNILCPPAQLKSASKETIEIFESFIEPINKPYTTKPYFLASDNHPGIANLVDPFTIADALELIEAIPAQMRLALWRENPDHFMRLFDWLARFRQRESLENDIILLNRFRYLPIWPSGDKLYQVEDLFIPTSSNYPLELPGLIDATCLRKYQPFLVETLKVKKLSSATLGTLLQKAGLNRQLAPIEVPLWFQSPSFQAALVEEIKSFQISQSLETIREDLRDCAIVYSTEGHLSPLGHIRKASPQTIDQFRNFTRSGRYLGPNNQKTIANLVLEFGPEDALKILEETSVDFLSIWQNTPRLLVNLIEWFKTHQADFASSALLKERLRRLPIWPSVDQLYPLDELMLPTNKQTSLALPGLIDEAISRRFAWFLRDGLGATEINARRLAEKIRQSGLTDPVLLQDAPDWIRGRKALINLNVELHALIISEGVSDVQKAFADCPIALSEKGYLCPVKDLKQASPKTVKVFSPFTPNNFFIHPEVPRAIKSLIDEFSVLDGLNLLEQTPSSTLNLIGLSTPEKLNSVIGWFANHAREVQDINGGKARLRALPIWMAEDSLHPLDALTVPGDFEDPIGLALILQSDVVNKYPYFLFDVLEARRLTIITYARDLIPMAFLSEREISADARRHLLQLLAQYVETLMESPIIRTGLMDCPLFECQDGQFYKASETYLRNELVEDILGDYARFAILPEDYPHKAKALQIWLGGKNKPTASDIIGRIKTLIDTTPPIGENRAAIQEIFSALGLEWRNFSDQLEQLTPLKTLRWLPAIGDERNWYAPNSGIYAQFQMRLFETQARFLDVPDQTFSSSLIEFLDIPTQANAEQIVSHLLECARFLDPVSYKVYQVLNREFRDEPAIERLKGQACLFIEQGLYLRPDQVFWQDPGLGDYRYLLGEAWREYGGLLDILGVKEKPDLQDIVKVLYEIGKAYNERCDLEGTHPLDDETHAIVLKCWRLLASGEFNLADLAFLGKVNDEIKVIPNQKKHLRPPYLTYIEDRPKLAQKFPSLADYIVPRTQEIWEAMHAAGVRLLSEVVQSKLVAFNNTKLDEPLTRMLKVRRLLIERVVEGWDLSLLDQMQVKTTDRLAVQYKIHTPKGVLETKAEVVSAFYHKEKQVLYIQRKDPLPWLAIAYEIAYALNPEKNTSQVAGNFAHIFGAKTLQDANKVLDSLGYAPLEALDELEVKAQKPLGLAEVKDDDLIIKERLYKVPSQAKPPTPTHTPPKPVSKQTTATPQKTGQQSGATARQSNQGGVSSAKSSSSQGAKKGNYQDEKLTARPASSPPPLPTKARPKTLIMSNKDGRFDVESALAGKPDTQSWQQAAEHKKLEEAGIKFVLAYEDQADRVARPYYETHDWDLLHSLDEDPNQKSGLQRLFGGVQKSFSRFLSKPDAPDKDSIPNPGYDILSIDPKTGTKYYIEVRALPRTWAEQQILFSLNQLFTAYQYGEQYWLYIVEYSKHANPNVICIQNPVGTKFNFVYRHRQSY